MVAALNRLVGNSSTAAVIETVGGLSIRADRPLVVATDLAPFPSQMREGDVIEVPVGGRHWHYVAVRGGIDTDLVLGSRSTDTLSGLGGPTVIDGTRLAVGRGPVEPIIADVAPVSQSAEPIGWTWGPRAEWCGSGWPGSSWTVSDTSRVGVRLAGRPIERIRDDELPSEGLVRGAVQVPPDGQPVMMLADHPTTGGYPVIAVIDPVDVARLAHTAPGGRVRIARQVSPSPWNSARSTP